MVAVADHRADKQVGIAVPVDVPERGTAAPVNEVQAEFGTGFLEGAVASVAVEVVRLGVAADDVEVHIAVAIDVRGCDAATLQFRVRQFGDDVAERPTERRRGVPFEGQGGFHPGGLRCSRTRLDRRRARATTAAANGDEGEPDQPERWPHRTVAKRQQRSFLGGTPGDHSRRKKVQGIGAMPRPSAAPRNADSARRTTPSTPRGCRPRAASRHRGRRSCRRRRWWTGGAR